MQFWAHNPIHGLLKVPRHFMRFETVSPIFCNAKRTSLSSIIFILKSGKTLESSQQKTQTGHTIMNLRIVFWKLRISSLVISVFIFFWHPHFIWFKPSPPPNNALSTCVLYFSFDSFSAHCGLFKAYLSYNLNVLLWGLFHIGQLLLLVLWCCTHSTHVQMIQVNLFKSLRSASRQTTDLLNMEKP